MHRQALLEFNATWQGNGTVQDLLIKLEKLAARMVEPPSTYMLWAHFVEAPHEPLKWEVLRQGRSTEFSKMSVLEFVQACRSLHIRLVICDSDYIVSSHMSHRDSACWLCSTNISLSLASLASLWIVDSNRLWAYHPRFVSDPSLGTIFRQVELTDKNFNLMLAFYITLAPWVAPIYQS